MDRLSELTLCEDDAVTLPLTARTVVFKGVWGQDSYASKIEPMLGELATKVMEVGLRDEGIAVLFVNRKDASLARLFFPGDTVTGRGVWKSLRSPFSTHTGAPFENISPSSRGRGE